MTRIRKIINSFTHLIILIASYLLLANSAFAAEIYKPFADIPGFDYESNGSNIAELVNQLYITGIALGATLGVLRIAYSGVKYTMSDVVSSKQSALNDIKGVFFGLGILLIPALVLGTINKDLLNLNVFEGFSKIGPVEVGDTNALANGSQKLFATGTETVACAVNNDKSEETCREELKCEEEKNGTLTRVGNKLVCNYVPKERREECPIGPRVCTDDPSVCAFYTDLPRESKERACIKKCEDLGDKSEKPWKVTIEGDLAICTYTPKE